jgi:hypothetical protein
MLVTRQISVGLVNRALRRELQEYQRRLDELFLLLCEETREEPAAAPTLCQQDFITDRDCGDESDHL